MTREDKELLLKDLCGRVPYGVKCKYNDGVIVNTLSVNFFYEQIEGWEKYVNHTLKYDVEDIKPYLFPLSSITEEESIELFKLFEISLIDSIGADYIKINECTGITFFLDKGFDVETHLDKLIDWLNAHHFDHRGLIEKGLAIDASGLNIY